MEPVADRPDADVLVATFRVRPDRSIVPASGSSIASLPIHVVDLVRALRRRRRIGAWSRQRVDVSIDARSRVSVHIGRRRRFIGPIPTCARPPVDSTDPWAIDLRVGRAWLPLVAARQDRATMSLLEAMTPERHEPTAS